MWKCIPSRIAQLVLLASLVATGLKTDNATAAPFTWIQPTCSFLGCGWSTPSFWSPSGPPGAGDTATIAKDVGVVLTESTPLLDGLTLENSAAIFTRGFSLNVAGTGANTFLFGTGTTGGNTQIAVNSGAGLGFDFVAFFLSLHQGAELKMQGGGVIASFGINISQSSLISGFGTVLLLSTGTKFDVAGTVRPEDGDLTLVSLAVARIDLDGNVGGVEPGLLDITANGNLSIQGSLADPFSGVINLGNSNSVEFDTALDMDGQLNFTSGTGNQLIAPSITFDDGAEVTVDQAIGHIDAISLWPGGATIQLVNPADELHLVGDSTFGFSTVFSGSGLLVNDNGATMTLEDGADVGTALLNDGTLEIGTSIGAVLLEEFDQTSNGRIKIELGGLLPGVDFDQISVTGDAGLDGMLDVTLLSPFTLSPGDFFEIINIDGVSTGVLNGLAEGSVIDTFDGEDLFITYFGDDGNDVLLYVPEPGVLPSLAFGAIALVSLRRRSRRATWTISTAVAARQGA